MPWPESLNINGATYTRETCSDGYVYRVSGVDCPHITIHNVTSPAEVTFDDWLRYGEYHVRYVSSGRLWEYQRDQPNPFMTPSGRATTNKGPEEPQANALAQAFWAAMQTH